MEQSKLTSDARRRLWLACKVLIEAYDRRQKEAAANGVVSEATPEATADNGHPTEAEQRLDSNAALAVKQNLLPEPTLQMEE